MRAILVLTVINAVLAAGFYFEVIKFETDFGLIGMVPIVVLSLVLAMIQEMVVVIIEEGKKSDNQDKCDKGV